MVAEDIIIRPVLTEKAYAGMTDANGQPSKKYVFIVATEANKTEIKEAVEKLFNVKVESVHTVSRKGKLKRMGRNEGYTAKTKKAVVQLKAESKEIEFFASLS